MSLLFQKYQVRNHGLTRSATLRLTVEDLTVTLVHQGAETELDQADAAEVMKIFQHVGVFGSSHNNVTVSEAVVQLSGVQMCGTPGWYNKIHNIAFFKNN